MWTHKNMKSISEIGKTRRSSRADVCSPETVLPVGIRRASASRGGGSGSFAGGGGRPPIRVAGVSSFNRMFGRKDGFTLLEVLVAFVLLATTVTVVLQLFSSSLKALSASEDYASAVVRVESKMREVLDNEQLSENTWSETSPEGYRYDIIIAPAYEARTKDLPLKILEIGVTMHWKMGSKEKSLTLNTMKAIKPQV